MRLDRESSSALPRSHSACSRSVRSRQVGDIVLKLASEKVLCYVDGHVLAHSSISDMTLMRPLHASLQRPCYFSS